MWTPQEGEWVLWKRADGHIGGVGQVQSADSTAVRLRPVGGDIFVTVAPDKIERHPLSTQR